MKAIPAAINRAMSCAPIRKRTMADVDLTPKPLPVRRKRIGAHDMARLIAAGIAFMVLV